jgi:hypothetical protein
MTPEQAAWVQEHAWPAPLRNSYAHAAAHPELAAEDYGCVCQLGPCFWCERGQHNDCRAIGDKVPAAHIGGTNGWLFRHPDGRVVDVWLADRTCRAMCPCHCRQTAQDRGLLFDLAPA